MVGTLIIRWTHTGAGDYEGRGEHSSFRVHRLQRKDIGVAASPIFKTGGWMLARKLGEQPFKVCGGPYRTAAVAKSIAERLEASI